MFERPYKKLRGQANNGGSNKKRRGQKEEGQTKRWKDKTKVESPDQKYLVNSKLYLVKTKSGWTRQKVKEFDKS